MRYISDYRNSNSNLIHKCFASKDPPTLVHDYSIIDRYLNMHLVSGHHIQLDW